MHWACQVVDPGQGGPWACEQAPDWRAPLVSTGRIRDKCPFGRGVRCDKLTHVPSVLRAIASRLSYRRLLSLRLALILLTVVPVLAVLGVSGYLGFQAAERWGEQRLQKEMELVARTLRQPMSRALARGDPGMMRASLQSVFEFNRIYSAHVYDADGDRIATAGKAAALEPRGEGDLAALGLERGEFGSVGDRDVYSYFVPLASRGGDAIGMLQVTRRASDFGEQASRLRWLMVAFIGGTAFLLVTLVLAGHHFVIGRPLNALSRSMAAVGSGERHHRTEPRGPGELADLSRRFNRMLDNMDRAEDQIARQRRDRQDLEQRLQHAEKMASVGRLAAGVAHEIGTPLAVIDGRAQRLQRNSETDPATRRAVDGMREQVRRIGHIVRQLLAFGHGYEGRRRPVRLDRCTRQAIDMARSQAEAAGVSLDCAGPEPAPEASLDRGRIEEALDHLLRNAIHAAGRGGRVRLGWFGGDGRVGFQVEDSGPGIPSDERERVLEPFYTTKPVGEGSGLGLAVVHGIVEEHGGRIELGDSDLGGAGVRIILPVDGAGEEGS